MRASASAPITITCCARQADAQAEHFMDIVPIDASALPPVIDLEHAQNCGMDQPVAEVRAEISVTISKLRRPLWRRPNPLHNQRLLP